MNPHPPADGSADRGTSSGDTPRYVTPHGLELLQARLDAASQALDAQRRLGAAADAARLAELEHQLLHWRQRLREACVVPLPLSRDEVQFGSRVAFADAGGHEYEVQLVGCDEADPARGLLDWQSPAGQALLGAAPGESVRWPGPQGERLVEILEIIPPRP